MYGPTISPRAHTVHEIRQRGPSWLSAESWHAHPCPSDSKPRQNNATISRDCEQGRRPCVVFGCQRATSKLHAGPDAITRRAGRPLRSIAYGRVWSRGHCQC